MNTGNEFEKMRGFVLFLLVCITIVMLGGGILVAIEFWPWGAFVTGISTGIMMLMWSPVVAYYVIRWRIHE